MTHVIRFFLALPFFFLPYHSTSDSSSHTSSLSFLSDQHFSGIALLQSSFLVLHCFDGSRSIWVTKHNALGHYVHPKHTAWSTHQPEFKCSRGSHQYYSRSGFNRKSIDGYMRPDILALLRAPSRQRHICPLLWSFGLAVYQRLSCSPVETHTIYSRNSRSNVKGGRSVKWRIRFAHWRWI
jgi:hypothetical protein